MNKSLAEVVPAIADQVAAQKSRDLSSALQKGACWGTNLAELLAEAGDELVVEEGTKLKLSFDLVIALINIIFGKIKEVFSECEGKTLHIEFPNTVWGNIARGLLGLLGIKL